MKLRTLAATAAAATVLVLPGLAGAGKITFLQMGVTPTTVAAGGTITVANLDGGECEGGEQVTGGVYTTQDVLVPGTEFIVYLDSLASTGDWSTVVTIPANTPAGTLIVEANCVYPFVNDLRLSNLDAQIQAQPYEPVPFTVTAQQQTSTTTAAPTTSTTAPAPNVVTAAPAYTG